MIPEFDRQQLGKRIRELRISQGLSQDALCDRIGTIGANYLSKIENGKVVPYLSLLVKILNALDVSFETLFDCEHLVSERELDEAIKTECMKLSLNKKRVLYRQIQTLKEFQG